MPPKGYRTKPDRFQHDEFLYIKLAHHISAYYLLIVCLCFSIPDAIKAYNKVDVYPMCEALN